MEIKRKQISTSPAIPGMSIISIVDKLFSAYNAARLREGANLWSHVMSSNDVTVGVTLSGALTPAGLGASCLVPLIKRGFIDYIVSTGANLYHDAHFALGKKLFQSHPCVDDHVLLKEELVRIYDIVVDDKVLYDTDAYFRHIYHKPEFAKCLDSAEIHHMIGKCLFERQQELCL